jgi:Na+/proline symporter
MVAVERSIACVPEALSETLNLIAFFFSRFIVVLSTAGRMIKTGLTASVIVSQWTWAATLLQSSNVAWAYGVSGPFWYVEFIFLFF